MFQPFSHLLPFILPFLSFDYVSLFYLVSLFCSLFGSVCLLLVLTMGDHFPAREFGWTESSGSEISVGPFVKEFDASSQKSEGSKVPFARHDPVLEADVKNLHIKRDF